jgi:hypothetical protein
MDEDHWNVDLADIIIIIASGFFLIWIYSLIEFFNPARAFIGYKLFFLMLLSYLYFKILQSIYYYRRRYFLSKTPATYNVDSRALGRYLFNFILPIIVVSVLLTLYFIFMPFFNLNWDAIFSAPDLSMLVYVLILVTLGWFLLELLGNAYYYATHFLVDGQWGKKVINKIRFFIVELFLLLFLFHNFTLLKADNIATWIISVIIVSVTVFLYYKTNTFDAVKQAQEKDEEHKISTDDDYFYVSLHKIAILGIVITCIVCYLVIPPFQMWVNMNVMEMFTLNTVYGWVFNILLFVTVIWWILEFILLGLAILFRYVITDIGKSYIIKFKIFVVIFITLKLILVNMQFLYIPDDIEYFISLGITLILFAITWKIGLIRMVV